MSSASALLAAPDAGATRPRARCPRGSCARSTSRSGGAWRGCSPATSARTLLGTGSELAMVRPYVAGRRRPADRLERHRADERAARPRRSRRARARDVARARHVALDAVRHGRSPEGGRRRGCRGRDRAPRHPPRATGSGVVTFGDAKRARASAAAGTGWARSGLLAALRERAGRGTATGATSLGDALARAGGARAPAVARRRRLGLPRAARLAAARCSSSPAATTWSRSRSATRASRSCPNVGLSLARRPRDRPPAARRHPQPQAPRALRRGGCGRARRRSRGRSPRPVSGTSCCRPSGDWLRTLVVFLRAGAARELRPGRSSLVGARRAPGPRRALRRSRAAPRRLTGRGSGTPICCRT